MEDIIITDLLSQLGEQLVTELRNNTPSASGHTRSQIEFKVINNNILQILGPAYIGVFETGRGPTRSSGGGGGQTLQEAILDWIKTAGITPQERDGKTPTDEQLSWMIAQHIHKHGNKLFQELAGGKTDYFDSVFTDERFKAFTGAFGDRYLTVINSEVIDLFKNPNLPTL